ncbi:hypothetical protein [Rhodobacter lacus]|uniref:Single-stranded DNA-binding protein n=1 Tax=Rhodobacter lacus TaxID=1641972 RepID=A0ABW5ADT4_9RHOB
MTERDNTNSGVVFTPHDNQLLSAQGKLNVYGADKRLVVVHEPIKRDGGPELVVYQRIGVLFRNDRKDNDRAPDFSGPVDLPEGHRLAAWTGEKDGRRYMSLKLSKKEGDGQGGGYNGGRGQQRDDGWGRSSGQQNAYSGGSANTGGQGGYYDDDIPF